MKEVWIPDTLHEAKLPGILSSALLIEGDIILSCGRPLTLQQVIFLQQLE